MRTTGNNGGSPQPREHIQPNIGLNDETRRSVVGLLNHTLADESVLCLKTRSAYWNASGSVDFDQQTLFAIQLKQLNDIIDEISRRARVLGGQPSSSFKEFLKNTRLVEKPGNTPDILDLFTDHESIVRSLREDIKTCDKEYEDAGTTELMVGVMRLHEKMAWTLRFFLDNQPLHEEKMAA